MNALIKDWLPFLLGDACLLYVFQFVLLVLFIFAELMDMEIFAKPTGADATVQRGPESWRLLNFSFGIIAVNVLQIINSADDTAKFKVLMSALDLGLLIRLFFFNGWFRNKSLMLVMKAQQMSEGQRAIDRRNARERRRRIDD